MKTRHASGSKLGEYLGTGRDLLNSELPTLRDVLRLGIKYQEDKVCTEGKERNLYTVKELIRDVAKGVNAMWIKANAEFVPPVVISTKGLEDRIEREWKMAGDIAWKRISKAKQIKTFEEKLDKLMDITKCRCEIITCMERQCLGPVECWCKDHITCSCTRETKLPVLDLQFLRSQRDKIGERAEIIISDTGDKVEHDRQVKRITNIANKDAAANTVLEKDTKKKHELLKRVEDYAAAEAAEPDLTIEVDKQITYTDTEKDIITSVMQKRNTIDISGLAIQAIRSEASNISASALSTAYLGDLIRAGVLTEDSAYLAVDPSKVQRAKEKVMAKAREKGEIRTQKEDIKCIMFDARLDKTKVRHYDEETGKFFPRVETQDQYTITDGDGRYLHHFTKSGKDVEDLCDENDEEDEGTDVEEDVTREKVKKPAEVVADLVVEWLRNHGVDETLQLIAGDSTNSNTGWKAGAMAWIEKKLGKKLHWLVCQLHTNELMLRQLITKLDGKSDSKTGFSGPIGKMLKDVEKMKPKYNFDKIDGGPGLIELPEEVIRDLSTDQNLLYKRCVAAITGVLPRDVALRKSGKMGHSRWLTMAETCIEMWQSEHGLEGELLERLRTLVTFIVTVYCQMWFQIKVKHSWLEGPRHVLFELSLYRLQSHQVQEIILPTLLRSAWNSHSESILQTMICSPDREEREFAVKQILKIRGKNKLGDMKPRPRKLPKLNINAENLKDMIDWKGSKEPVLTCNFSKEEIKACLDTPLKVPYFCLHTQGIERAIKEVREYSF